MISFSVDYSPTCAGWILGGSDHGVYSRVAVGDANSGTIRIYKYDDDNAAGNVIELSLHAAPVK